MAEDRVEIASWETVPGTHAGRTYADPDRGLPPKEVRGPLRRRPVAVWGNVQCEVGGELVDPATVRPSPQSL